ncbi:unnamed protein product [Cylicocyclus nassatus]|uniref:Uncharacterized protein n=1 Tax=Cylicocyclus nassatus TaxID=53992 RepID=A0AA36GHI0_CYLNA|nr:unnamed protein product [Cylicocyclus nassatus]
MRCNLLKYSLLLTDLLLIHSLRCFQGHEGTAITVKESGDGFMCAYETMKPCDFKQPSRSANFRTAHFKAESLQNCWSKDGRVICYCNEDFCNGNFRLFQQKWSKSEVQNKTLYDCVLKYIAEKSDLPIPLSKPGLTTLPVEETKAKVIEPIKKSTRLLPAKTANFPIISVKPARETAARATAGNREKSTKAQQLDPEKSNKVPEKNGNEGSVTFKDDDENSVIDRKNPADDEPFDRKEADVLMFVIIAIGVTILVCLIIPAAVYVVKNRKTDMKGKTKLKHKSSMGRTSTSAAKSEGRT